MKPSALTDPACSEHGIAYCVTFGTVSKQAGHFVPWPASVEWLMGGTWTENVQIHTITALKGIRSTREHLCASFRTNFHEIETRAFEPLHIRGRTGYLMKATLLEYGYTVLIKATIADKEHHLRTEAARYRYLRRLQGHQIPVCVGNFKPRVSNI